MNSSRLPLAALIAAVLFAASGCSATGNEQAQKALDQGQRELEKGLDKMEKGFGDSKQAQKQIDQARKQSRRQIDEARERVRDQSLGQ